MESAEYSSALGTFMLLAWPVLSVVLFARFRASIAVPAALLAAYVLLPPRLAIDLPVIPALDKESGAALAATLVALFLVFQSRRQSATSVDALPGWIPRDPFAIFFLGCLIVGPILTVLTNRDRIPIGDFVLPGLRPYDAGSIILANLVMLVPLLLGRKFLFNPGHHRDVLIVFAVIIGAYSILGLYEVRMSPQLNMMVYGYFPHDWIQHLRQEGFRPLVFLTHGLILGILMCLCVLSAIGAARTSQGRTRLFFIAIAGFVFATLALSKSLGALMIAVVLLPVAILVGRRLQLLAAAAIAVLAIGYPYLRAVDVAPVGAVIALAERIDPVRASSFAFRIENEDILLEKARERPLAGWGGWGRNRVYDDRGRDISVTDGYWIGTFGMTGVVGYLGQFGLLTIPLIALAIRTRRNGVTLATSALALVAAANLVDLLPNASIGPFTWLLAGAMLGRLEAARSRDRRGESDAMLSSSAAPATAAPAGPAPRIPLRHTRFAPRHIRTR
ncbi:MAG: hypothetical protein AAF771_03315 [Pseudomonadota bacterium]